MKKSHLLTLAIMAGLGAVSVAHADSVDDTRWYVSPFGSFVNTGGDRGADDGWGAGMGFGKMLNKHFNVELKGFYQNYESNQGDWDVTGGTADLMYFFSREKVAPYTVIGAGGMNTSVGGVEEGSFIGEAGAGLTYEVNDNFLLRSDVRYRYNNNFDTTFGRGTDEFHDMVVNVGFVVPFGPKPAEPVKFQMPAPVVPTPKAPDCSTMDSDSDGVNDCADQCPATMAGSKVDYQGCPISLELKGVNFKVNSAELTVNAMRILDGVAASLIGYPEKDDIEVRGHTSSEGSDAYNLKLSQKRSQSVVNYLKLKGVTNRLTAKGYGESQPIADNVTEQGRSLNRRVELVWMGK